MLVVSDFAVVGFRLGSLELIHCLPKTVSNTKKIIGNFLPWVALFFYGWHRREQIADCRNTIKEVIHAITHRYYIIGVGGFIQANLTFVGVKGGAAS